MYCAATRTEYIKHGFHGLNNLLFFGTISLLDVPWLVQGFI